MRPSSLPLSWFFRPFTLLLVCGALVAAGYLLNGLAWSVETKASTWVAIGTLLLAFVTFLSVFETRQVIFEENRRFELGKAPLLLARTELDDHQFLSGFVLENLGEGVAIEVELFMRALLLEYVPGRGQNEVPPEDIETKPIVGAKPWTDSASAPAVAQGGQVTVYVGSFDEFGAYINLLKIVDLEIRYKDMFHNRYRTVYTDFAKRTYRWEQPSHLAS
jgi:hypothetical protein